MRRNKKSGIIWSDKMIEDLLKCKRDAMALKNSGYCPRLPNGRKRGYMEIMYENWNNLGYRHLNLTAQNLRDRASQAERTQANLVLPLQNVINEHSVIPSIDSLTENMNGVNEHNNDIPSIVPLNESVIVGVNDCNNIPNADLPVINEDINYTLMEDIIPNGMEEFVNDNACIVEASKKRFNEINIIEGDMSQRKYQTKWRNKPAIKDIECIDKLCFYLFRESNGFNADDATQKVWILNCATYSSIVTWSLSNDIKLQEVVNNNRTPSGNRKPYEPRWLQRLENEIADTRRFISQCVNERNRIRNGGRLTRKLKRNRKLIEKKCKGISVYNLTVLIEKLKNSLRYKAKKRKKKLKAMKTRKMNEIFIKSPSDIYKLFDDIIKKDKDDDEPKCSEIEAKERNFFQNVEEVESFWKGLWTSADKGKPQEDWLNDIEANFKARVPITNEGDIYISHEDVHNAIRKKRNWSSPGPDRIVNIWWKYLKIPAKISRHVFNIFLNETHNVPRWYCRGRTPLLEKDGEWSHQNQRPITCLNTHYKWLTSTLLKKQDKHLSDYNMLQIDQRGAKINCCGTSDNLLIDDMILRDACYNKKNMSCAWLDVKKAYDSVSHTWLKRMLVLHRLPRNITLLLENIIDNWNLSLVFPIENGVYESGIIKVENGILQGDSLSGSLYCLCKNPISWHLRRYEGYMLSMTSKPKITHSLYIDDAKIYARSKKKLKIELDDLEEKMSHAGLFWNEKKCKVLNLIKGRPDTTDGSIILESGRKIDCLKDAETYRFLGVPEAEKHDTTNLFESIAKKVKQRMHVIWSSPLYDINKVTASNQFAIALVGYYMWSEKFTLDKLRQLDRDIRGILNVNGAKHPTQMNELLYTPRSKGGRGLKCIEEVYKDTKIKSAVKLALNPEAHMQLVKSFHLQCQQKRFASIFTDAIKYGEELGIVVEIKENSVLLESCSNTITCNSMEDKLKVKQMLKKERQDLRSRAIRESTWQGLTIKNREADETICKGFYDWSTKWKTCPTHVIREIHDMIYQLIPTKAYLSTRSNLDITNKKCRYCHKKEESVIHLVSSCNYLAKYDYMRRHNKALQCFINHVLLLYGFIDIIPPWFSKIEVKPHYNNEKATIWYDIPEFMNDESGESDQEEENQEGRKKKNQQRPDGKILLKEEKQIYVIEMSVPWISNRDAKYIEKVEKYERIRRSLKINYPDHTIDQITLIIDVFGGHSNELPMNIEKIIKDKSEVERIIFNMQKVIMADLSYLSKKFKATADVF